MPQESKQEQSLLITTTASAIAGSIGKFVMHPVDTIKAKWQVSTSKVNTLDDYRSGKVKEIIKKTWKTQGIPGFFRGVCFSSIGSAFAFSGYMTTYEFAKRFLIKTEIFKNNESFCHLISGFIAEIVSCSMWLPIDIIKERMQVQSELKLYKYDSGRDAIKKIHGNEGVIGLYRAFGATLMSFGPFSALFFVFYQKFKQLFCQNPKQPGLVSNIIASTLAGSLAGWLTTPLQLAKLRMQIQRADKATKGAGVNMQQTYFGYKNMFHGIYLIWKKEGFLALYRGSLLRVMFSAPISTISMTLTQVFKKHIRQLRNH